MKNKLRFFIICLCFITESTYAQVSFPKDYFKLEEHKITYPQITEQMFDTLLSRYKPEDYSEGDFHKHPFLFKLYDTTIFDNLFLVEVSNNCAHRCQRIYAIDKMSQKILDSVDIKTFNKLVEYSRINNFDRALSWIIFNNLENRIVLFEVDSIKFANKSMLLNLFDVSPRIGNIPKSFFDSLNQHRDTIHIVLYTWKGNYIEKYFFCFNDEGVLMNIFKRSYMDISPYGKVYKKKRKKNK